MQKELYFMLEYTYILGTSVDIFVTRQDFSSSIYLRSFHIVNKIEAFIVDIPSQQDALW
jgi:hypothetical protein